MTFDASTVPKIELRVILHKYLLDPACVVDSKVRVYADVLGNAIVEISFYSLISLILLSCEFPTQLNNEF